MNDDAPTVTENEEGKGGGCLPAILVVGGILLIAIIAFAISGAIEGSDDTVVLDPPPGSSVVQMFDSDGNVKARFSAGTECEVLRSFTLLESGIEIPMHELNCEGETGLVNQKWSR